MIDPGRTLTAMVTPFDENGAVDYVQAKKLALALLDSGSDGLVIVGTTGESPTLLREEESRLFSEIKATVGSRGAVIAGTGSNSTAEAITATRIAEEAGADGCLLVVPYYNKPPQEGLYRHFEAIADSTGLPCILYNVPSRTVTNLSSETTLRLSRVDNIIGIKEASGDMEQIARIIDAAADGFRVWSGNDSDTLPMLSIGAYGVISVAAHLVGKQIAGIVSDFIAGNPERAAATHRRLLPLVTALFVVSNPIPVKYALNHLGFRVGAPRLPLTEPDETTAAVIIRALAGHQIDLPV